MSGKRSQLAKEWGKFVEAVWIGLPKAAAKEMLGGVEDELGQAGWQAYDAWVSLTNEATNQLYTNPVLGAMTAGTTENFLRLQQIGNAAASAFFANLWPAIGLPTVHDVATLRTEISDLRQQLDHEPKSDERIVAASYGAVYEDGFKLIRNAHVRRRDHKDGQKDGQDAAA
jgi:hypothetical protein